MKEERIGQYDLVRVIGNGASSTVYLARDTVAQRDVAIKIAAHETLDRPERAALYAQLFMNEASLVGKLMHPNIVQIYDAVVTREPRYIVMEYVQGGTIREYGDPGKLLPVRRVVEIIRQCAHALDFAHSHGVTHRDIKPANILYTGEAPEGDVKITDFGAAIVDHPESAQVSGIGSLAYMSPEQLHEFPLDHRTDIYSLGVVLYQMLTGQMPFQASRSHDIIYQILNIEPPSPSRRREEIPKSLDDIVARAMRKDADERFATWEAFILSLTRFCEDPSRATD